MIALVVDLDDTLISSERIICKHCGRIKYVNPRPIKKEIDRLNKLYKNGRIVIIHTARSWDYYELTKKQLSMFNIKYHELIMGKPQGIYIDKDAKKTLRGIK
jgi:hydroxymethylpyrimidine pyrophosphatase-like HAD family hydrolase